MKEAILAFSGLSASGKTAISSLVSRELNWRIASFGAYIREQVRLRGDDPESREALQFLGNYLIAEGWGGFCRAVLIYSGWQSGEGLVIDGVRHIEALSTIREIVSPQPVYLIHVQTSPQTRAKRFLERGVSLEAMRRTNKHDTELQAFETLPALADYLISGDALPDIAAAYVTNWWHSLSQPNG